MKDPMRKFEIVACIFTCEQMRVTDKSELSTIAR